jgi:hypothetical protein
MLAHATQHRPDALFTEVRFEATARDAVRQTSPNS